MLHIATLFALAGALSASAGVARAGLAERGSEKGNPTGTGSVYFNTILNGGVEIQFYHDANRGGHVAEADSGLNKWHMNTRGNETKTYVGKVLFIPALGGDQGAPKCRLERKTDDLKKVHHFYFKHDVSYLWPCLDKDHLDPEENQAYVTCEKEEPKCTPWTGFNEPLLADA